MKTLSSLLRQIAVLMAVALPYCVSAQSATNLAGLWNGVYFALPASIAAEHSGPYVTNVAGSHAFSAGTFQITVLSDGTFSGSGAGTYTIDGQGKVSVYPSDGAPVSLRVNAAEDVFVGLANDSQDGYPLNGLNLLARAPASVTTNDVAGSWRIVTFDSPKDLVNVLSTNGILVDLQGMDNQSVAGHDFTFSGVGTMVVSNNGTVSGNAGNDFTGTYSIGAYGQVSISVVSEDSFVMTAFINAGKDTMFCLHDDEANNRQEVIMMTKNPTNVSLPDLRGVWRVTSYSGPAGISLTTTGTNAYITAVNLVGNFSMHNSSSFIAGNDGFITAAIDGQPYIGGFSAGANGVVSVNLTNAAGNVESHSGYINASKNCITLSESDSQDAAVTIVTKSPEWPGATQEMGFQIYGSTMVWAADSNRVLQATTTLGGSWTNLEATLGTHEYPLSPTNSSGFYRVGTE